MLTSTAQQHEHKWHEITDLKYDLARRYNCHCGAFLSQPIRTLPVGDLPPPALTPENPSEQRE